MILLDALNHRPLHVHYCQRKLIFAVLIAKHHAREIRAAINNRVSEDADPELLVCLTELQWLLVCVQAQASLVAQ
jgi:hypothetical protein